MSLWHGYQTDIACFVRHVSWLLERVNTALLSIHRTSMTTTCIFSMGVLYQIILTSNGPNVSLPIPFSPNIKAISESSCLRSSCQIVLRTASQSRICPQLQNMESDRKFPATNGSEKARTESATPSEEGISKTSRAERKLLLKLDALILPLTAALYVSSCIGINTTSMHH